MEKKKKIKVGRSNWSSSSSSSLKQEIRNNIN